MPFWPIVIRQIVVAPNGQVRIGWFAPVLGFEHDWFQTGFMTPTRNGKLNTGRSPNSLKRQQKIAFAIRNVLKYFAITNALAYYGNSVRLGDFRQ
jgi:hypothetical protein